MASGKAGAQDHAWTSKERGEEARYVHEKTWTKEQAQLSAIQRAQKEGTDPSTADFEGGFGGQEDLEDRYATTCGEH